MASERLVQGSSAASASAGSRQLAFTLLSDLRLSTQDDNSPSCGDSSRPKYPPVLFAQSLYLQRGCELRDALTANGGLTSSPNLSGFARACESRGFAFGTHTRKIEGGTLQSPLILTPQAAMSTAVSAPGKVFLAGGYLVLDRAYTALVFGLSARIHILVKDIESSSGVQLSEIVVQSPQFRDATWTYGYHLAEDQGGIQVTQLQG